MRFLICIWLVALTGCASLNSVSLTPVPAERNNRVSVQKERTIILGFNFDNDYVDDLALGLREKCPGGKITGILTKDEVIMYFLFFVWKRKVTASGYCSNAVAAHGRGNRKTAEESDGVASGETAL